MEAIISKVRIRGCFMLVLLVVSLFEKRWGLDDYLVDFEWGYVCNDSPICITVSALPFCCIKFCGESISLIVRCVGFPSLLWSTSVIVNLSSDVDK